MLFSRLSLFPRPESRDKKNGENNAAQRSKRRNNERPSPPVQQKLDYCIEEGKGCGNDPQAPGTEGYVRT